MNTQIQYPNTEQKIQRKSLIRRSAGIGVCLLLFAGLSEGFSVAMQYFLVDLNYRELVLQYFTANQFQALLQIAYTTICCGVPAIIGILAMRIRLRDKERPRYLNPALILPLLFLGFGVSRISNTIANQISTAVEFLGFNTASPDGSMGSNIIEVLLMTAAISIGPAIFEELLFRGMVLQGLRKHSSDSFAILISALFFGIFHGNIVQAPFAFVLGLYLGWMVVYTNSIIPAMLLHFINNFISCVVGTLAEWYPDYSMAITIGFLLFSIILMAVSLPMLAKYSRRDANIFRLAQDKTSLSATEKWKSIIGNVPMILVVIYFSVDVLRKMLSL
ncbi:MAG: CPBP family intramembrane metalloprotease [Oscillospiraceae bacterium]|jgi:membrane protease YdiL (CAAX protease family)|nr:CPBP family intramembrane metalloprotease [Oscillospiraceae bacterium]